MTAIYRFDSLLAPGEWLSPGWMEVDPGGDIVAVSGTAPEAGDVETVPGHAVPGMVNLHSHAFQRAMAGLAERAGPAGDSFWTWRETMYGFVEKLGPDHLEAIAAQLYVEMLRSGYTSVGEFHYLHHAPDGTPYDDRCEMSERVMAAARHTGIGMTLLPVLYTASGFGGAPTGPGQRRFAMDVGDFLDLVTELRRRTAGEPRFRVGVAPHSLRAVPPKEMSAMLAGIDSDMPVHIHIAEQMREVDDCLAWSGSRPVDWLLDNATVDGRWCLVHATHMTGAETARAAATGAIAGLCPTTEANLGDGLFPLRAWLDSGGRIGIGSDSHVSVSPVEELRWLEYGQRLTTRTRNVAADGPGASTGAALTRAALDGGAGALGRPVGALAAGRRADVAVLDSDHPVLAGRRGDTVLDSWLFSGNETPVRDVMAGGEWVVRGRRHRDREAIAEGFRKTCEKLWQMRPRGTVQ